MIYANIESMMTGSGRKSFKETQGRAGTEKIRNRKHALHAFLFAGYLTRVNIPY